MLNFRKFSKIFATNPKFVRHKHAPDHWSVLRKKNKPVDKALAHFDDFYKQIFDKKWDTIRQALLSQQKYVAIVNNYSDTDQIISNLELNGAINVRRLFEVEKERILEQIQTKRRRKLLKQIKQIDELTETPETSDNLAEIPTKSLSLEESLRDAEFDYRRLIDKDSNVTGEILNEFIPTTKLKGHNDFVPESQYYQYYQQTDQFNVKLEREYSIEFPQHLNVYCYEEENFSDFQPARTGSTGVLDYYLMNGASILPILALDLKPGNSVLDMCAAPGGKTLLMLQTLYPISIVANDVSKSRTDRIYNVCRQFLYDFKQRWLDTERLRITSMDGRRIRDDFDRILVDVPCTNDRLSLHENDNNIFKPARIKERLKLPEIQCELLVAALKLVRKGGIVVYSTCSLSPIQNDGVVYMALKQIWEETKLDFIVKDLSFALLQTKNFLYLADAKLMKYGQLVVPHPAQNYGPMYFCKLQRIA